jgi:hypothetical protein
LDGGEGFFLAIGAAYRIVERKSDRRQPARLWMLKPHSASSHRDRRAFRCRMVVFYPIDKTA